MPNYKKFISIFILISLLFFSGCNQTDTTSDSVSDNNDNITSNENSDTEPTDTDIKSDAIQADFAKINNDEVELNTKLFTEGQVGTVFSTGYWGEFSLTATEDDGYGMYTIVNLSDIEVSEGETVKLWGTYYGKDDTTGIPEITVTLIEK